MSSAARLLALGGLAVLLALAAACSSEDSATPVPTDTPPAEPDTTPPPTRAVEPNDQRIVYVTNDFVVFTIRQDGTGRKRIVGGTGGAGVAAQPLVQDTQTAYTWPTWSPDATKLAFSSFRDRGSFQFEMRLFVTDIQAQSVKEVFSNPLEDTGPIA